MKMEIVIRATRVIIILFVVIVLMNLNTTRILLGNWFASKERVEELTGWTGGKSYEHVQYSEISDTDYLNLYVPESDEPLPLYIMVHGGGFFFNDLESRQANLFCQYVRNQGYAVATVNYRLGDEALYPAAIEDVKAAVRFLRANADVYGLDGDRFAIAGESAGGYLASMTAVTTDQEFMSVPFVGEEDADETVSAKVQALVDFYGCMEFFTFEDEFETLKIPAFVRNISNYWMRSVLKDSTSSSVEEVWIGKNMNEMTEEELASYTVNYYAKKNLNMNSQLSVVIMHGDADLTVPYLQSEHIAEVLEDKIGTEKVSYRLFHNYGHAADGFYSSKTLDWMLESIDLGK